MSFKTTFRAATALAAFGIFAAAPAFAEIKIEDPYARVSAMMSKSGAAFMQIMNTGDEADHLVSAQSDIAQRVELHTHKEDENGVMRMLEVPEGWDVPAGGALALQRGGNHVMFLGLNKSLEHGDTVSVTLTFEKAGDVVIEVPVDLERKPMHGKMNHGNHGDGKMKKMAD